MYCGLVLGQENYLRELKYYAEVFNRGGVLIGGVGGYCS